MSHFKPQCKNSRLPQGWHSEAPRSQWRLSPRGLQRARPGCSLVSTTLLWLELRDEDHVTGWGQDQEAVPAGVTVQGHGVIAQGTAGNVAPITRLPVESVVSQNALFYCMYGTRDPLLFLFLSPVRRPNFCGSLLQASAPPGGGFCCSVPLAQGNPTWPKPWQQRPTTPPSSLCPPQI